MLEESCAQIKLNEPGRQRADSPIPGSWPSVQSYKLTGLSEGMFDSYRLSAKEALNSESSVPSPSGTLDKVPIFLIFFLPRYRTHNDAKKQHANNEVGTGDAITIAAHVHDGLRPEHTHVPHDCKVYDCMHQLNRPAWSSGPRKAEQYIIQTTYICRLAKSCTLSK